MKDEGNCLVPLLMQTMDRLRACKLVFRNISKKVKETRFFFLAFLPKSAIFLLFYEMFVRVVKICFIFFDFLECSFSYIHTTHSRL